jgi:RNA polymerase sigma-70 factor, ECF subfamily
LWLSTEGESEIDRRIQAARRGNTAELGNLLETCRNYLLLTANQELETDLQAKVAPSDIVQKTFFEACRDFHQFRGSTQQEILGWLRGILLHNLANVRRDYRDAAKRELGREQTSAAGVARLPHDVPTPGTIASVQEQRVLVLRALDQLPEHYRRVLLLRQQDNLQFDEIGRRLGKTGESVRKMWARAVEQLKDILKTSSAGGTEPDGKRSF